MEKIRVAWCKIDSIGRVHEDVKWEDMTPKDIENRVRKSTQSDCALVAYEDIDTGIKYYKESTREMFLQDPQKYGCACYKKGMAIQWE